MKQNNSRYAQAISKIINKLKSSSGFQREKYISKVKKQFKLDENEKWVVTKLRMILFRMEMDFELFQIQKPTKTRRLMLKEIKSPKETILIKAVGMKESKGRLMDKQVAKKKTNNQEGKRENTKDMKTTKQKVRKSRLTLEEKQLNKLRSIVHYEEEKIFWPSKHDFLHLLQLVPAVSVV